MGLLGRMMFSARKVWLRVAAHIGIRRTGLLKLRKDVKSCEYEDVHVMWQILERHEYELEYEKFQKRSTWSLFRRGRRTSSAPVLWRQSEGGPRGRARRPLVLRPSSRRYFISTPVKDREHHPAALKKKAENGGFHVHDEMVN